MRAEPAASQDLGHHNLFLAPLVGLHAVRLIALAHRAGTQGLIHLAQGQRWAEQLVSAVKGLSPDLEVHILPPWDCLPYDSASPSRDVMGQRISVLRQMAAPAKGPRLLITSPAAIVQRVPPRELWASATFSLKTGDAFVPEALENFLHRSGYVLDDRVDEAGEAAIRGQVIDLFPANCPLPYRAEHDGSSILSIRRYDPVSQRTEEYVDSITLEPASEVVLSAASDDASSRERYAGMEHRLPEYYRQLETVFDYWPDAEIVMEERAEGRRQNVMEQIADAHGSRNNFRTSAEHAVKPEQLFILDNEWQQVLNARQLTVIRDAPEAEANKNKVPFFASASKPAQALSSFIYSQEKVQRRIVLVAETERDLNRLRRRVQNIRSKIAAVDNWSNVIDGEPRGWFSIKADVRGGFIDDDAGAAVITAYDVLGSRVGTEVAPEAASVSALQTDLGFHIGDTVVHIEHGIGRLEGIEAISLGDQNGQDAIRLAYADEAKIMVPATEMDQIWRYGSAFDAVKLDRLNGDAWIARRETIETEIQDASKRLRSLVDERRAVQLDPITPPSRDYERFVARFAFTETSDQARAIEEVLQDLASGHPMDRLVCGDVGFGKTEVALRAAAAVALSGKQVAVVAPTTVLARQHLRTFQRRFAGLAIEIAHLSRLVTPAEARGVKKGLADGSIRIVVGTHALTGKGISFKDLGIVIIDEEQRFGAAHKSKLRQLGCGGHVLTLTATPIPRTLQSSLVGLQDISIIATPPARRQPIRTFLASFDPATVREALMREKRRAGQSFLVCSRIEDIEPMREQLIKLVPELELIVAHGQMPPAEADEAMVRFADGEGDVLLATNIIESGLDVPRANTMLVWRADRFGLAQLHQLRGRVGRGRIRGTAYLLTEPDQVLPKATEKRLRTLVALDRLGAGFAISAQDLDQRGAGSLLGEEQAGHIKLIGTDLYQHMLRRALRGESIEDAWSPDLNIGLKGTIPVSYINDPEARINLYARISRLDPLENVEDLETEIEDRFGALPQSLQNLINLAELKQLCVRLGIARIDAGPQAIALTFRPGTVDIALLEQVVEGSGGELRWSGERLILARSIEEPDERLKPIVALLDRLA
ncbi:transcription-repair coupling factor [Microvirga sp. KLBC 81]|uniref:transcription-repair coupling factor n=1 Tax=Microvirga sp. KLBC 81 TaxID=1862707 RepID=UPI000D510079|nr:transcription-repair coupling factor [Microvirga sp. KLBC 81]PVE21330.1 transcription-repair coupling factor [Microvirga sp. KLBC 81]